VSLDFVETYRPTIKQPFLFLFFKERDASLLKLREAEREIDLLKDRLEASQTGWSDARRQLEEKVCRCEHHGGRHGVVGAVITNVFLEALAHLLSDSRNFVEPNEERIKERVRDLVHAVQDKNAVSLNLDDGHVNTATDCCSRVYSTLTGEH